MSSSQRRYAKGIVKRAEILDVALDVVARAGYSGATVKELAEAVGLSQNGLLHYFGSKDALFTEILRHRDEAVAIEVSADGRSMSDDLAQRVMDAMEAEMSAAGMTQLSLGLAGEATESGHFAHEYFRDRYDQIRRVVRDAVEQLQREGQLDKGVSSEAVAALIFAAWDGLQLQWMFDRTIDIRAHMAYLLSALDLQPHAATSEPPPGAQLR